jgi:anti-sigma B factor antagonist
MNNLEVTTRDKGNATVIDVKGELTIASNERVLDTVRRELASGRRYILVNLGECSRIDSSGLGELVTCLITAARQRGRVTLTRVPGQIYGLMKITNLHKAFEIFEDEEGALAKV